MNNELELYQVRMRAKKRVLYEQWFYLHLAIFLIYHFMLFSINFDFKQFKLHDWFRNDVLIIPTTWVMGLAIHYFSFHPLKLNFMRNWEKQKIKEYMDRYSTQ